MQISRYHVTVVIQTKKSSTRSNVARNDIKTKMVKRFVTELGNKTMGFRAASSHLFPVRVRIDARFLADCFEVCQVCIYVDFSVGTLINPDRKKEIRALGA